MDQNTRRLFRWAILIKVLVMSFASIATADPYTDALRVGVRYRNSSVEGQVHLNAFQPHQYLQSGGDLFVEATAAIDALRLRSSGGTEVRVCVSRKVPDPTREIDFTGASQDRWEDFINGVWVPRTAVPTPCYDRPATSVSVSLSTTGAQTRVLTSDLVFGSEVFVEIWAPTTRNRPAAPQAQVQAQAPAGRRPARPAAAAPAPAAVPAVQHAACALSPDTQGQRTYTDQSGDEWVLVQVDAHVWDWDEYRLFEYDGGYESVAERDAVVPVSADSRIVVGRLSEGAETEGTDHHYRRRVAWGSVNYDAIFGLVCVTLKRPDHENALSTLESAGIVGEPTDRGFSLSTLPVGETGILTFGIRTENAVRPCFPLREIHIVRRPVGFYATFPIVTEIVSAATHLDPTNVRSSSTMAVSYGCSIRPDFRCNAGAIFPFVFSYNTRRATVSNYVAGFVGPQVLLVGNTPHLSIAFGARLLNSILVGASYDLASDGWQLTLGGDVTGLGELISRFSR